MGKEPVAGLNLALERNCIDGDRFTPGRILDPIFRVPNFCSKSEKSWKDDLLEKEEFHPMTDVFESEYDVIDGANMVSAVNQRYRNYVTVDWKGQ